MSKQQFSIYKFGGASIKDAESIKTVLSIITQDNNPLGVVLSAIGKTTNKLEQVIELYFNHTIFQEELNSIIAMHKTICLHFFKDEDKIPEAITQLFNKLQEELILPPTNYDADYDRIICYGELLSSTIISEILGIKNIENKCLDARKLIKTNSDFREAKIDWPSTEKHIKEATKGEKLFITQGFIGSNKDNRTTTLGREGSDFTGAIFASCINATSLTVWKDVEGIKNANPSWYPEAITMPELSYNEAVEQAFYGASIIHPKTIKPLENKQIPLYVKSFLNPQNPGTIIHKTGHIAYPPVIIRKDDLTLVTIASNNFSFIVEDNLQEVFKLFSDNYAKVQIMESSALKFSACIKVLPKKLERIKTALSEKFRFSYNNKVKLYTIRHYTSETIDSIIKDKTVVMEQKNRSIAWFVTQ